MRNAKSQILIEYPLNIIEEIGFNFMQCDSVYLYENFDKNYKVLKTQQYKNILNDREFFALDLRYKEHKTFSFISNELGVIPERVRKIIFNALIKLKKYRELFEIGYENVVLQMSNEELKDKLIVEQMKLKRQLKSKEILEEYKKDINFIPIENVSLSSRTYCCLNRANIYYLNDLKDVHISDLKKIRTLGEKTLDEILEKLDEYKINYYKD